MNITPTSRNNRHLILFDVAPYNFCAPTAEVESIIMLPPVSRLPMAPPSVIGLINHRGQVYRVISLRRKLGLETGPPRMEGQLILTSLPTGLTAFLVDEVVDVLLDTGLARRPLSPHSAMDLFDAFILRDDQVLFHTTFSLFDQAPETPYPNPDLKALERMAAREQGLIRASDRSTGPNTLTDPDEGEAANAIVSDEAPGLSTPHPVMATFKDRDPERKKGAARPPGVMAAGPTVHEAQPHPLHRPDRETPLRRRTPPFKVPRRTRRYALALTAALLLLLFVTLSTGLLHLQPVGVSPPPATGLPVAARPADTHPQEHPEPSPPAHRPPPLTVDAHGEPPLHPASETLPSASRPTTVAPPPPETTASLEVATEETPPFPRTVVKEEAPRPPAEGSGAPREILRMETEAFTLLVERPSSDPQRPPASQASQVPPASTEIVHRVVAGDTLWDIAEHYLGDPFQYPALARLSQIHNPDLIYPGDVIHIIKKTP